jgi:hypothetical protein
MGPSFAHGSDMSVIAFDSFRRCVPGSIDQYLQFIDHLAVRWLFYYVTVEDVARPIRLAVEARNLQYGISFISAADTSLSEPTLEWFAERVGRLPNGWIILSAEPARFRL